MMPLTLILQLVLVPALLAAGKDRWDSWGSYGQCSRTCGGGVMVRSRRCITHRADGGHNCVGPEKSYLTCNTEDCPEGSRDFREEQCAQFDGEDFKGNRYTWLPYYGGDNPCELNCMPKGENFFYRHGATVVDGTLCHPGRRDVCVEGVCKRMGCDNRLESRQQEDPCLQCGGRGQSCSLVKRSFSTQYLTQGYNQMFTIPAGATSISIRENTPTRNYFAIKNLHGDYYLNGRWSIESSRATNIAGTVLYYQRGAEGDPHTPETIIGRGPTTEPLVVELISQEHNSGVQYEFYVPVGHLREGYTWRFGSWSACSTECGSGYQSRNVFCNMDNEASPDYLCASLARPESNRTCNAQACPSTYSWKTGPWNACSVTCGAGKQVRSVHCSYRDGSAPRTVQDTYCGQYSQAPAATQNCNLHPCDDHQASRPNKISWHVSEWGLCSRSCTGGSRDRQVVCADREGNHYPAERCYPQATPAAVENCNNQPCSRPQAVPSFHDRRGYQSSHTGLHPYQPQHGDEHNKALHCSESYYGCCPDGVSEALGFNDHGCNLPALIASLPSENAAECRTTTYGCCYDRATPATGPNGEGCRDPPSPYERSICSLPKAAGTCGSWTARYFYNVLASKCVSFWYGSCHGNSNNFLTEAECQRVCELSNGNGHNGNDYNGNGGANGNGYNGNGANGNGRSNGNGYNGNGGNGNGEHAYGNGERTNGNGERAYGISEPKNGERSNGNGRNGNGHNGERANGNDERTNGNGQRAYGISEPKNGEHSNGNGRNGERANGNGERANGNGERANGNDERTNGNGQRAYGISEPKNGERSNGNGRNGNGHNGERANGNGERANGNGERANGNGRNANGYNGNGGNGNGRPYRNGYNGNGGNRNGERANGNGERANGNGERANGNGERANGNGERANGNGERANGNGERANGNGRNGNGYNGNGQNGNRNIERSNGNSRNGNGERPNGNGHNGNGYNAYSQRSNGNGENGNGENENGENGNGYNGNGENGNGYNGNGHNGNVENGNGHNGNGGTGKARSASTAARNAHRARVYLKVKKPYLVPANHHRLVGSLTLAPVTIDQSDPDSVEALAGQTVVLPCRVRPPPSSSVLVEWRKDSAALSSRRYQQQPNGSLLVGPLSKSDSGWFLCVATRGQERDHRYVYLSVSEDQSEARPTSPPTHAPPPPSFSMERSSSSLLETRAGQPARLPCHVVPASALKSVTIEWTRDGRTLSDPRFVQQSDGALLVEPIRSEDSGVYTCTASTRRQLEQRRVQVRVQGDPVTTAPTDIRVPEGTAAQLPCVVSGDHVSIGWSRNGVPVRPDGRNIQVLSDGSLVLSQVQVSDQGTYTCNAYTGSHSVSASADITLTKGVEVASECVDQPDLANCQLVVYSRLCSNQYYASFCCASCTRQTQG
ncbi:papilin-like [Entelurus aequoreus]|uniref:papilin-like n=1 Tax=Entelurus aequoreus TaxID=161455 RepID=UPI002B1D9EDA|nr:papilin-like [Entelurus aequoreus]